MPGRCSIGSIRSQLQIALDNAKANLAQTELTINSMKQDYQRMLSDVKAQQAQVDLDQVTYDRYASLVKSDSVSKANYDQTRFTLQADKSKLASLEQQAQVQLARLAGNPDIPVDRASAISAGQGAGRRGAARARSYDRQGTLRRHRHRGAFDRARQVPAGLDDRLLSRRLPITSGSTPIRRRRS